jgi:hypothetical protein
MSSLREPGIERPLGPVELMLWRLDQISCLNVVLHAEIHGPMRPEHLRQGLDAVQRRHPQTRVRIQPGQDQHLWFRSGAGPIPLRVVDIPSDGWQAAFQAEINTRFAAGAGPLLRVVCLRHAADRSTLFVTFHHAMGDGLSGAYLVRDLVQATAMAYQGQATVLAPLPPRPYLEKLFPARTRGIAGWLRYVELLGRAVAATWRHNGPQMLAADATLPLKDRRWHSVAFRLEVEFTRRLMAKARSERTTVSGALAAALALTVAHELGGDKPAILNMGFPVNLRDSLVPQVEQECGAFATGITCLAAVGQHDAFWDLARSVNKSIKQSLRRDAQFLLVPKAWRVYRFLVRLASLACRGKDGLATFGGRRLPPVPMVSLSNLGRLKITCQHGPLRVETMGFMAGVSIMSRLYATALTLNDILYWHIGGVEPVLSRQHIEHLAETARAVLQEAVVPSCSGRI